ncbi:hypothetical protein [Sporocytophaga myxococcoides]|uniref:hypothetical protein n=1 Tax=Sporocytophaga myxococcoides TaxID=153721 RepID=UPI000403DC5C|nr:hypothetical protein [Sporocytophaga myxococcoides]
MKKILLLFSTSICISLSTFAQTDTDSAISSDTLTGNSLLDMSIEELLGIDVVDKRFKLYGYIDTYAEKTFGVPTIVDDNKTGYTDVPFEWNPVRNFHLYGSGNLSNNIDVLINIARTTSDGLEIRNAWGNFKIKKYLQVKVGKMYRRFGLYNERLDQIPTFIGIEPPELFDVDHLFLTRTTNFMVHGAFNFGNKELQYALSSENGEGGAAKNVIPVGWDLRLKTPTTIIGTSGFTSSINAANRTTSTVDFGKGSPRGGVLPWMQGDHYGVYGAFIEKGIGNLIIQAEYWASPHKAIRNADNVLTMVKEAGINKNQRERFLGAAASKADADLTKEDVVTKVSYVSSTWYVRVGYNINTKVGQFVPYIFADWMTNPEVINNKTYGGDEESGFADNGIFFKPSLGLVYRPIPSVAIKVDGSIHSQKFNGRNELYPELRMDFSFAFKQWLQ